MTYSLIFNTPGNFLFSLFLTRVALQISVPGPSALSKLDCEKPSNWRKGRCGAPSIQEMLSFGYIYAIWQIVEA